MASVVDYQTETIDLGSNQLVNVEAVAAAPVGFLAITMQIGLTIDGGPVGSFVPIGIVTARYVKVRAVATDPTRAHLGNLSTVISTA